MKFIHTADWQIGKPFARVEDPDKRARLRAERVEAIQRIGAEVRKRNAAFILVAGDLFDSPSPDKATVSAACAAIGKLGVPVLAVPGNHDHGGPGSIWEQEFFLREQKALAPNLRLLGVAEPVELDEAVILPCPLVRRQGAEDATAWLRPPAVWEHLPAGKPRIVLAHGSTQGFSSASDEEGSAMQPNLINLDQLDMAALDYVALGDWHGAKQVGPKAWYSGTPELDRFPKGGEHDPGNILSVELPARGSSPVVEVIRTGLLKWHVENFTLVDEASLTQLEARMNDLVGGDSAGYLVRLGLSGTLGLEGSRKLEEFLERWKARLVRLKVANEVRVIPSDEELARLAGRQGDPVISAMASRLKAEIDHGGEQAGVALLALRELYATVEQAGEVA